MTNQMQHGKRISSERTTSGSQRFVIVGPGAKALIDCLVSGNLLLFTFLQVKDASYDHPWSVTTLKGHTAAITGMDFAQDGKKFVTVSADRTAFLWDVRVSGLLFKQGNAR